MTDDLIARLEKATGPDRELFEVCYDTVFGAPQMQDSNDVWNRWHRFRRFLEAEAWTDAALMLVPEGCATSVDFPGGHVTIFLINGDDFDVDGATPALSICIAAMKARKVASYE